MFALVSEVNCGQQTLKFRRAWSSRPGMEVVSINEFERHQLRYQDRIMESAVDQLEALTQPVDETAEIVVRFGEMKVDDSLPRLFEFDPPTTCRKWPGLRFGSFCLHKQVPKPNFRAKPSKRSSEKKHGRLEDLKHGNHPRKITTHKPRKAQAQVSLPTVHLPMASRNPPLHIMDLPPEVRNEVWTLLSVQKESVEAQLRPIQPRRKGKIIIRRFPQEPSLAAVSKKLRKEVLSLFYGMNKFVLEKSGSSALTNLDMTKIAAIQRWKPSADVADFISKVEIRLVMAEPGMMMVAYEIKRMSDASLTISISSRSSRKKGLSGSPAMCLCVEESVAQFCEKNCGGTDLIETVTELLRKRAIVSSTAEFSRGGICKNCGLERSKY